jgi:hypothetical protein
LLGALLLAQLQTDEKGVHGRGLGVGWGGVG